MEVEMKTLIVGIVTCLIVGYIVGQSQIGDPYEEISRLKAEKREILDTYLQYKDACFDLKEQLENLTTHLALMSFSFQNLQMELEETKAEYEALQHSYAELEEEYDELNAKYLDLIEAYNAKFATFSNLTITPTVIELGGNVTISFYVTNILHESCDFAFATQIEGPNYGCDIMDCITLGGYETKKISHTETPEVVGNHTVRIGRLTGSFQVLEKG